MEIKKILKNKMIAQGLSAQDIKKELSKRLKQEHKGSVYAPKYPLLKIKADI